MTAIASPWTAERDARLRALWMQHDPRLSAAAIAAELGTTKNAIVGRAARLGLPGRESPIRRVQDGAAALDRAKARAAQAHVRAGAEELVRAQRAAAPGPVRVPGNVPPSAPRPARLVPQQPSLSPHRVCQWIRGEARGAETVFCGAPTVRGRSYCAAHLTRCLALAIDVSGSVSDAHFVLQRDATAEALEQPVVRRAMRDGLSVAVLLFGERARVVVPPAASPDAAAAALRGVERSFGGGTNIAAAVRLGVEVLAAQPCEARVLDVSGDGRHNTGPLDELAQAVGAAAEAGVQINVLPVVTRAEPDIAEWMTDHLARPTGGFVVAAEWGGFARAIRHKLAAEVAAR